jgi:hypothetical protein
MSYTPKNVSVYLNAMSGASAGLGARLCSTDSNPGDFTGYTQMADAFAQQIDAQWLISGGQNVTTLQLQVLRDAAEEVWSGFSPLENSVAFKPGSYAQYAKGICSLMLQANTQVVSEGINPNQGSGGAGSNATSATVSGGQTYQVLNTDSVIKFDSSNAQQPIAVLPNPTANTTPAIGETHTFIWWNWEVSQVPPVIKAGGAQGLTPVTGMTAAATTVVQSNLTQVGQSATYKWTGTEWVTT